MSRHTCTPIADRDGTLICGGCGATIRAGGQASHQDPSIGRQIAPARAPRALTADSCLLTPLLSLLLLSIIFMCAALGSLGAADTGGVSAPSVISGEGFPAARISPATPALPVAQLGEPGSAQSIGWLLLSLAALAAALNQGWSLIGKLTGRRESVGTIVSPQPLVVEERKEFATVQQLQKQETEIKRLQEQVIPRKDLDAKFAKIDTELTGIKDAQKESHTELMKAGEERITRIEATIRGELKAVLEQVVQHAKEIGRLEGRTEKGARA